MSFERFPRATATTTTDAPVIIAPGRTVQWPVQTVLTIDGTPDGAAGWSHSFDARGSGSTRVNVYAGERFLGDDVVVRATLSGGQTSVNPTPSLTLYRTVRGLMPGRQYRLSAHVTPDGGGTRIRTRMGGQVAAWVTATDTMTQQNITFTATGDEEDIVFELEDNPATSAARAAVELAVNRISLTGLAYTEVIPPVINDQVAFTVHEGKITCDAGWAPFVQGDISVPLPTSALAATLDPNSGSRVKITASSVRELVAQFTPWVVVHRNIHRDPGHTGTSRAVGEGVLMSCYDQMAGSNVGTSEKPNRFLLADNGAVAQEINVKTLPAGAVYGLSLTTAAPANGSTKARLYLAVQLDTFAGGGAVPNTIYGGIRVIQGSTTILTRTQNMTANGLTQFLVDDVALDTPGGPSGIRIEVYIGNRATSTWTTPGTTVGVKARIRGGFSISGSDASALPVIDDAILVSDPLKNYLRYRKVSNTVVMETRADAPPVLEAVDTGVFDLAIAEREIDYDDGAMRLTLASDEYLLQRFAKPGVDATPRAREHSLRSICEYVIGQALTTAPPLSGTVDGDLTAQWPITNLVVNPSGEADAHGAIATNWSVGQYVNGAVVASTMGAPAAVAGTKAVSWTSLAGGDSNIIPVQGGNPRTYAVKPGTSYVWSYFICSSAARTARAAIQWWSADGSILSSQVFSAAIATTSGAFRRVTIIATAPPGTTHAYPYVNVPSSAAATHYVDGAMFYQGNELVPYFDGSTGSTARYTYSWANDPHGSTSTRTPIGGVREPSLFTWKAGVTAWDFLTPLVNSRGLRLWCDASRVWHLTDPATYTAPGLLAVTPATTVETLERVDGERGENADGVVINWTWTDDDGTERSHVETAGTIGKIATLDIDAPYPGPGTATAHLARLRGRGTEMPLTIASDYRANPGQPVTIVGPEPAATPTYTPWVERRRNLHTNPINAGTVTDGLALGNTSYARNGGVGTYAASSGWQYIRATSLPAGGRVGFARTLTGLSLVAGQKLRILARRINLPPTDLTTRTYLDFYQGGSLIGGQSIYWDSDAHNLDGTITVPGDADRIAWYTWLERTSGAAWTGATDNGYSWFSVEDAVTSDGTVVRAGDPAATLLQRTIWDGTAAASASSRQTREVEGARYSGQIGAVAWNLTDGLMQIEPVALTAAT